MRVLTWNLERGGRNGVRSAQQSSVVAGLRPDISVLTEPHAPDVLANVLSVSSPVERQGNGDPEPWVVIAGSGVEPLDDLPYSRMAAAATVDLPGGPPSIIYGSVLPWRAIAHQAPDLVLSGETYAEAFERVLSAQVDDIHRLRQQFPEHELIWAGDFNHSLVGPNYTGTAAGRLLLSRALAELGLTAWNASQPHAIEGMNAVDLICGSTARSPIIETISTTVAGRRLSDHLGYVADSDR